MERLTTLLERGARGVESVAALGLAVVTLVIFASAIGRYMFATPIPDAFDISRLLLGLAIAWGYAVLGFRGGHICVDLLATALPPRPRHAVAIFAQAVLFVATLALAWMMFGRVLTAFGSGEATFDLRLPVWPLIGGIWLGFAMAALTTLAGLLFLVSGRSMAEPDLKEDFHE